MFCMRELKNEMPVLFQRQQQIDGDHEAEGQGPEDPPVLQLWPEVQ